MLEAVKPLTLPAPTCRAPALQVFNHHRRGAVSRSKRHQGGSKLPGSIQVEARNARIQRFAEPLPQALTRAAMTGGLFVCYLSLEAIALVVVPAARQKRAGYHRASQLVRTNVS